jgi:tetratricopeptide (TPR) repeat protein
MDERLAAAVRLREAGELEPARKALLQLAAEHPDDAVVQYQTAWAHDAHGLEAAAVPFYELALELGLDGEDLRGALLGLGSTLRTLGTSRRSAHFVEDGRRSGRAGPSTSSSR